MSDDYNEYLAQQNAQSIIDEYDEDAIEGEELMNKLTKGYQRQQHKHWQQRDQQIQFEEFERFKKERNLTPEQIQDMQAQVMQDAKLTEKAMRKKHRKALETIYNGVAKKQGQQPAPAQPGQRAPQQQPPVDKQTVMDAAKEKANSQKGGLHADERYAVIDAVIGDLLK